MLGGFRQAVHNFLPNDLDIFVFHLKFGDMEHSFFVCDGSTRPFHCVDDSHFPSLIGIVVIIRDPIRRRLVT